MKEVWVLGLFAVAGCLVIAGCVTSNPYAAFRTAELGDGSGCKILFDGNTALQRTGKDGVYVYGLGDSCPKNFSDNPAVTINRSKTIELGKDGRFARLTSFTSSRTGFAYKTVIRKNDSSSKRVGAYLFFSTTLK
jgi:hypothetical protein